MLHFLSAEALYGLLLVTTFATVGLLGLWAATSRWHPFLRTAIVLAILSVLLLRPMYEPFVMLVSQVATIAAGVAVYHWFKNRKLPATDATQTRYQFSLKTLLFVSTLAALGAAIAAKAPSKSGLEWVAIAANGVEAGFGTLFSVAVISGRVTWWRLLLLVGAVAANSYAVAQTFVPVAQVSWNLYPNGPIWEQWSALLIFGVLQTLLQLAITGLWLLKAGDKSIMPLRRFPRIAQFAALFLLAATFALPGYLTWRLLNPLPLLGKNSTSPNAYHDLAALGKRLERTPLQLAYIADPQDPIRLAQEIANHAQEYQQLYKLLELPSVVPDPMVLRIDDLGHFRTLARLLSARSEAFARAGNVEVAIQDKVRCLRLAKSLESGLLTDWLTSIAIEGVAMRDMYVTRSLFNAKGCQLVINELMKFDSSREAPDRIARRDAQYTEHAYGWLGQLYQLFDDLTGGKEDHLRSCLYEPLARTRSTLHLLVTELALRKYQLTHNSLPDNLDQLVPDILPEVPRDPFHPAGGTLRYKRTDDGYILYSVSQNGVDDGGIPPDEEGTVPADWFDWWQSEHGDLRLDHYFSEP